MTILQMGKVEIMDVDVTEIVKAARLKKVVAESELVDRIAAIVTEMKFCQKDMAMGVQALARYTELESNLKVELAQYLKGSI